MVCSILKYEWMLKCASHGEAENGDKNVHFVMLALLHRVMRIIMRADFGYFCATLTTHFSL